MQQFVKDSWLNPQLLGYAAGAPAETTRAGPGLADRHEPPAFARPASVRALEELIAAHDAQVHRRPAGGRPRQRTTLRQMLTLATAATLLLASAAFSYLAWIAAFDDAVAAEPQERVETRTARPASAPAAPGTGESTGDGAWEDESPMRSTVMSLREENNALRQRLETLRNALEQSP